MANVVWKIESMKNKPVFNDYQNLVVECQWSCTGTQTNGANVYTSIESGVTSFSGPAATFTPYSDLTEQQVLEWVWDSGINKQSIELQINKDLSKQISPPLIESPLPWNQ